MVKIIEWIKQRPTMLKLLIVVGLALPIILVAMYMLKDAARRKQLLKIFNKDDFVNVSKSQKGTMKLPESKKLDSTLNDILDTIK